MKTTMSDIFTTRDDFHNVNSDTRYRFTDETGVNFRIYGPHDYLNQDGHCKCGSFVESSSFGALMGIDPFGACPANFISGQENNNGIGLMDIVYSEHVNFIVNARIFMGISEVCKNRVKVNKLEEEIKNFSPAVQTLAEENLALKAKIEVYEKTLKGFQKKITQVFTPKNITNKKGK